MNQSKYKILSLAVAVALLLGLGAWALSFDRPAQETNRDTQTSEIEQTETTEAGRTEITYLAQPGMTSLEQLKAEAKDVVTQESEYGELVDSIEGHKGGANGNYWSFYVNGEMAQVGAGSYIQQEGDWIEWKFQKL